MAGKWLIRVQGLSGGVVQGHNEIPVELQEWFVQVGQG